MVAIEVDKEVFNKLKQSYQEKFGKSFKKLISKLHQKFNKEFEENDGDDLISERTIRNFFNSSSPPKMREVNLNYLCNILLDCESYQQAVNQFCSVSNYVKRSWLESYLEHIRRECNSVKVLTMDKPVSLNDIFVKVNIIESIKGRQAELQAIFSKEKYHRELNCNRFGQVVLKTGVPGIEVVKKHHQLMIWGMAGAGKTTFLKYLAMHLPSELCVSENVLEAALPFFISLKKLAENQNKLSLFEALIQEFAKSIPADLTNIKSQVEQFIYDYLNQGKCLIFLDGLDEVLAKDIHNIYKQIDEFNEKYNNGNYVVITCRHGACEYVFKNFIEVEIADFDEKEIEEFIKRWFKNSHNQNKLEQFLAKLEANKSIKELAKNPLLLTLLCLVAGENYDLPVNRYSLYEEAVDILLRKWDATRNIERSKNYTDKLSRQRKLNMLGEIAYHAFIQKPQKYFWHKWEIQEQIRKFIENIDGINKNIEDESQNILKAMEAHNGILTEQAKGIYSFSHLTFQEYFTAQHILESRESILEKEIIKQHLTDPQWREVFVIIGSRLAKADDFLKEIFFYTNEIVKSDELQKMLKWLDKLTNSFEVVSSSWRAMYLTIDLDTDLYIDNEICVDRRIAESISIKLRNINEKNDNIIPTKAKCFIARNLSVIHSFSIDKAYGRNWKLQAASEFIKKRLGIDDNFNIDFKLNESIDLATTNGYLNLGEALKFLQSCKPCYDSSELEWQQWADNLQKVMSGYLDIGYDVKFSEEDAKALDKYLYLNNLLLDCILADSYAFKDLREELINHLLLPKDRIPLHLFGSDMNRNIGR
ncbi:NACHT domain-containing protein [Nostoc cycadae]|uniref:NACHT domain protein n=1 Tax=Nostoc cycadae WK-1 TaxID=1861711 RepID=A0A2H6LHK4_9NOSO|nr:NACHT domain-containing protein [Nostoc cycadae]GBE92689.1 NACHT domain protein [Nostoc cycadae WK-1]